MSETKYRMSFLDLPCEVRLNIYEHVFRTTDVKIHVNTLETMYETCAIERKKCVSLLSTNKLIAQEATPVFLKETTFFVPECSCWDFEGYAPTLPPIKKLIVPEYDPSDYVGVDTFKDVFHILDTGLPENHKLELLKFEPCIHLGHISGKDTRV